MPRSPAPAREAAKKPRARNARPKIERAALKLFIHEGVDAATTREGSCDNPAAEQHQARARRRATKLCMCSRA